MKPHSTKIFQEIVNGLSSFIQSQFLNPTPLSQTTTMSGIDLLLLVKFLGLLHPSLSYEISCLLLEFALDFDLSSFNIMWKSKLSYFFFRNNYRPYLSPVSYFFTVNLQRPTMNIYKTRCHIQIWCFLSIFYKPVPSLSCTISHVNKHQSVKMPPPKNQQSLVSFSC